MKLMLINEGLYDQLNIPKLIVFDNTEWTIENNLLTISSKPNR